MNHAPQILVVEDDQVSRNLLRFMLSKLGYAVKTADDAADAQEQLTPDDFQHFDCVVTDYRMPNINGLDLLLWIKNHNLGLSTILVTSEGEKHLVKESLRGGAIDFLDKPIDSEMLRSAVERAVASTQRQRQLAATELDIKEVGRAQERMLDANASVGSIKVEVCFHPKHAAGGDFFNRYQPAPNLFFCLLTDVSGHDLRAAYVSAFFQGVVRGMLERSAPVEEIFVAFNRFLLEEWNEAGTFGQNNSQIKASIAACALLIDEAAQTAKVFTYGTPAPVYWSPNGEAKTIGENGGFPLGWFPVLQAQGTVQPIAVNSSLCLWTDGLAGEAEKMGVSPLSLACAMREAKNRNKKLVEIDEAEDDILLADICFSTGGSLSAVYRPIIFEQYHGGQTDEIDRLQDFWRRSLILVAPNLPASKMHDILLASREGLLNALQHGCGAKAEQWASFQIAFCRAANTFRVRICDPGPGHDFNLAQRELCAGRELTDQHTGLIFIKHLSSAVIFDRKGASLQMDFACS